MVENYHVHPPIWGAVTVDRLLSVMVNSVQFATKPENTRLRAPSFGDMTCFVLCMLDLAETLHTFGFIESL